MIRHQGEYRAERREAMRGGAGSVLIEHFWEPGPELRSPTRMCARLTLEPGSSIGFHRHEAEEEIFVIVRGEAEVDDDGRTVRLRAGDTVLTGGGAGHAVKSVGAEPLEMVALIARFQ